MLRRAYEAVAQRVTHDQRERQGISFDQRAEPRLDRQSRTPHHTRTHANRARERATNRRCHRGEEEEARTKALDAKPTNVRAERGREGSSAKPWSRGVTKQTLLR